MAKSIVTHSTFVINRNFPQAPPAVFAAFADPAKKRRWFAEGEGFVVDEYEMDFSVGGSESARFRFTSDQPLEEGTPCANDTVYMDIVADRRIVIAYTMTVAGKRISSSLATKELIADGSGTRLVYTEQAAFFEGADGPKIREQGMSELLKQLAKELTNQL